MSHIWQKCGLPGHVSECCKECGTTNDVWKTEQCVVASPHYSLADGRQLIGGNEAHLRAHVDYAAGRPIRW